MAMQSNEIYQGRFSRYGRAKVPKTACTRQNRAEGLSGGAPKGCYGKLIDANGSKAP